MDHISVISLGWECRYKENGNHQQYVFGDFIMAVLFNYEEDFHLVTIKNAEGINVNKWENSDPVFHGMIKTDLDLKDIMRFGGIIEY